MTVYRIGLDEVGRGPLAGPIVGAAVFSSGSEEQKKILAQSKDSKILTTRKREYLAALINENFLWSVRVADNNFIDQRGIQTANIFVLQEALNDLLQKVNNINHLEIKIFSDYVGGAKKYWPDSQAAFFKKGESKHPEIAAASIIAKVWRDELMKKYHKLYPQYNFLKNKGYGTREHFDLLAKHGPSVLHRRSFLQ